MNDTQPPGPALNRARKWTIFLVLQIIGLMALGSLLTIIIALAAFALFAGTPASSIPISLPVSGGQADVTARVDQGYVNREVAYFLTTNPITILTVGQVSEAVIQFNPDSTMDVTARIKALGRQIDVKVKDRVFVKENKLALALAENPKLEGLGVPLDLLNGVIGQVNTTVANQLNGLVQGVGTARDCISGKPVGRIPTLQKLNLEKGVLVAEFSVAIKPA